VRTLKSGTAHCAPAIPLAADIPPQIRNQIAQLQQIQQQAQTIVSQRVQLEMQVKEMERTLEELAKTPEDAPVYRSVGTLLIRVKDRQTVAKDLEDSKETTEVRLNSLKRQEERLKEKLSALQREVSAALSAGQR